MTRPTSRALLTGAAMLTLALTGCSAQSGGSGSGMFGSATATAAAGTSGTSIATNTTSTTSTAATNCTPQTTSVASASAATILSTLSAELPKSCGFTVSGFLDGSAELPDGLPIEGSAVVDSAGNVHVAAEEQGIVVDIYAVSGSEYVHMYEPGQPSAAPDSNVQSSWGSVLTSSQVAAAGTNYVKLTATQLSTFATGGMGGNDALLTPGKLAADLTSYSTSWTKSGTATVDGVSCVQISAPGGQDAPATEISVNAATGLPVQIAYTASQGATPTTLSFTAYGTTAAVNPPSGTVDGASLS